MTLVSNHGEFQMLKQYKPLLHRLKTNWILDFKSSGLCLSL